MAREKILIVDDEPKILKIIKHSLQDDGFLLLEASNGVEALEVVEREYPDLMILDLMMPGMDGFEVCRRVRAKYEFPILILSAKDGEIDKVVGFNLGVDDYLTKPFSPMELALRVKAILRRTRQSSYAKADAVRSFGGLEINNEARSVTVGGRTVDLTAKEFDLLWFLATHPNQAFTRSQLFNNVWGAEYLGDANTVTVLIRRLREKIEADPANPGFIKTIWGVGYKFEP
ncbi:MAG: response regulator transcription factor [Actinomycetota bacterium]|nr:response regulator transcription factor [Actinomycetota bacterium]